MKSYRDLINEEIDLAVLYLQKAKEANSSETIQNLKLAKAAIKKAQAIEELI